MKKILKETAVAVGDMALFVGKEVISTSVALGVIGAIGYHVLTSGLIGDTMDKILSMGDMVPIEAPAQTCEPKLYDKVYESCRRSVVDSYYDQYKQGDNKLVVEGYCEGIAKQLTCKLIESGDKRQDDINKMRVMSIPTAESMIAFKEGNK